MKSLVALCVGHSRMISGRIEGGAVSVGNVNEWAYNKDLAERILLTLREKYRIDARIYDRYEGGGYSSAQRWLAGRLKSDRATVAIELHFNSASSSAMGHEWLHWHSSENGKHLAESLHSEFCQMVPDIRSRGIKSLDASSRGAEFVKGTHCPAVIAEPFFGSNVSDWQIALKRRDDIARAIAEGIASYLD